MDKNYEKIINLPHHVSETRPHMPMIDRAAQFAPFAALSGYDAAVEETARLTSTRAELDETAKAALDEKLRFLFGHAAEGLPASFTYFVPDEKKAGGAYVTERGILKKIDPVARTITLQSGLCFPLDELYEIDGDMFD